MNCPLCASVHVEAFLVRDDVPVHQNLLFDGAEAATGSARGQLCMSVCIVCGFVFNAAFDAGRITYGRGYDNDQTFSAYFDRYVESLVAELAAHVGIDGKMIAEIGCGTGYFLRRVVGSAKGSRGIGYDPSYTGAAASEDGTDRIRADDFYRGVGRARRRRRDLPARDRASARSVGADVGSARPPQPATAVVVFETPSVEWILRHGVVWDFFYEHCSLFSACVARACCSSGAASTVQRVSHVFNEQYLWLAARPGVAPARRSRSPINRSSANAGGSEISNVGPSRSGANRSRRPRARGGVAGAGAPGAKGTTFVNLVDPDARLVTCLVDVNPRKQGRFVAGTGHAVVAPDQLAALRRRDGHHHEPELRDRNPIDCGPEPRRAWSLSRHDRTDREGGHPGRRPRHAAQRGDRRPPKPMVEIGGKPILWHIMKIYSALRRSTTSSSACGYKGYVIKEYFANYFLHMSDVTFDLPQQPDASVHQQHAEPGR